MEYTYTEIKDKFTDKVTGIYRSDNSVIPLDLANSDYQRYLAWLENPEAEQSTPIVTGDE